MSNEKAIRRKRTTSKDIQLKFGLGQGKFINFSFLLVVKILLRLAELTKLSYNQINVILYFFAIPFAYLSILDYILHFHYLKLAAFFTILGFFIGCRDFRAYSDWLFSQSVKFLKFFKRFGLSYESASIWICVVLPAAMFIMLLLLIS
jgi:hypothetical protein